MRLRRRDKLAVILDEFPRRASHFKRHLVGAMYDGEAIARIAMPQSIVNQIDFQRFKSLPEGAEQGGVARILRDYWPGRLGVRFEPCLQSWKNRNDAPPAGLCFAFAYDDLSAVKINVLPFKAVNLGGS